jgi:hypothetical protein
MLSCTTDSLSAHQVVSHIYVTRYFINIFALTLTTSLVYRLPYFILLYLNIMIQT